MPKRSRLRRLVASRRFRKIVVVAVALAALPWMILIGVAVFTVLPPELASRSPVSTSDGARPLSVRIFDRDHHLLRDVRTDDQKRADRKPLADFGDDLVHAVIAAEDRRFYRHPGVDPIAMARAFGSSILARRIVSGASTLTQQLARNVTGAPRNLSSKLSVMALALRIEASLSKDEILEEYLNRVEFGPQIRGAEAAARYYFDKPAKELSLAEAAALAGIPRGPSLYDPKKGTSRLLRRRNRVLDRMASAGLVTTEQAERAKNEPIVLATHFSSGGAPHFVRSLVSGTVDPCADAAPIPSDVVEVTTTLDIGLEREVTELARATVRDLDKQHVTAASVVVLDNTNGDILAYVGAPDFADVARLGQNDGARALRQPGSSLKPFVYELGMEKLGMSPSTLLPDLEMTFATADGGDYRPQNYDERFHGPVLLRDALGSSFNVPAVWTAERIGVPAVVDRLRAIGLCSISEPASHYGLGVALGDPEVQLISLANAYATLARGGVLLPVRGVLEQKRWDGTTVALQASTPKRILDERATYLVTDVLADKTARLASFGEGSVLELPFAVAAKTGTSKGYRDNITVGFTPEVTVAVWVGNFDGSPMKGVSGITGAGPLFRSVMLAAARRRPPTPFIVPEGIDTALVCPLSGKRPQPDCHHRRVDMRMRGRSDTVSGDGSCDMHVRLSIEKATGLVAGPGCPPDLVQEQTFEWYPSLFVEWAKSAGRPLVPTGSSTRCPGGHGPKRIGDAVAIVFPEDGARFFIDEAASSSSAIRFRTRTPSSAKVVTLSVDGHSFTLRGGGLAWRLVRGDHIAKLVADGTPSDEIHFRVE